MRNKKNNLFLASIKSNTSKSNLSEHAYSSSASSPSNTSTNPASPSPDLLFVNRAYRDNLHAWQSLAPEIFHAGTSRGSSPAITTPSFPTQDTNHSSLPTSDCNKTCNIFLPSKPSTCSPTNDHRKNQSYSIDATLSSQKEPFITPPADSTSFNPTPKRRKSSLPNEKRRLKILRELDLLDGVPEEAFDRITTLASRIFQCPIAMISFMDETSQYFKSRLGIPMSKIPRDVSFNTLTFLDVRQGVIVIRDTHYDDRFEPITEKNAKTEDDESNKDNDNPQDNKHCPGHHRHTSSGTTNADIRLPTPSPVHTTTNTVNNTTANNMNMEDKSDVRIDRPSSIHLPTSTQLPQTSPSASSTPPHLQSTSTTSPQVLYHTHLPKAVTRMSKPPPDMHRHHSPLHFHQFQHMKAHLRFFATTSIFVNHVKIGCLTICDVIPHYQFSANDELMLLDLAGMVSDLLQDRRNMKLEEERKTFQTQQEALLRIQAPLQRVCCCAEIVGQGISEVFYGPNKADTCAIYTDDVVEKAAQKIINGDKCNNINNMRNVSKDDSTIFMKDTGNLDSGSADIACISSVTMEGTAVVENTALDTQTSSSSSDKFFDDGSNASTVNHSFSSDTNSQLTVITGNTISDNNINNKDDLSSHNHIATNYTNGSTSWFLSTHLTAVQCHPFSGSYDIDTSNTTYNSTKMMNNNELLHPAVHHLNANVHPFLPKYSPSLDTVEAVANVTSEKDADKEEKDKETQQEYPLYSFPNKDAFLRELNNLVTPALQAFEAAVQTLDKTIEHTLVQHLQAFWSQRQRNRNQSDSSVPCTPVSTYDSSSSSKTPHNGSDSIKCVNNTFDTVHNVPIHNTDSSSKLSLINVTMHSGSNVIGSLNCVNMSPVQKYGNNITSVPMRMSSPYYNGISPITTAISISQTNNNNSNDKSIANEAYNNSIKYE